MAFPDDPLECVVCHQPVSVVAATVHLILCPACFTNYGGPLEQRGERKKMIFAELYTQHTAITARSMRCLPEIAQSTTKETVARFRSPYDNLVASRRSVVEMMGEKAHLAKQAQVSDILQFTQHRHPCRHCGFELGCGIWAFHGAEDCEGKSSVFNYCPHCGCPLQGPINPPPKTAVVDEIAQMTPHPNNKACRFCGKVFNHAGGCGCDEGMGLTHCPHCGCPAQEPI